MQGPSKHHTTCPLCEAMCGLEIQHEGARITRIAGDENNSFSRGFICPKGASLGQLHEDPDRLHRPLVRDRNAKEFREVDWPEAFAAVQAGLGPIRKRGERNAIALYLGNPTVHSPAGAFFPRALARALGTQNIFTASTVDQMPKHVSCGLMFGDAGAIPVPDLDRTDYLLMLGANPWESNGSLCTAPDFPGRIKALRERGGRLIVVDPRRTRTAEHADQHIAIRPGTDAHLLLGIARVLFEEGLVRLGKAEPHVAGLPRLKELVAPFTLAAVSKVTGVAAETIGELARDLARHERAVVYGRIGTHTTPFGTLAAWAVDVLNVLTGHLDVPGGAMWALPAHTRRKERSASRFKHGRWKSRVKGYPEVKGEFPVATLADEIETPGSGQVRALITVAGNPVLSSPQSGRLDRAMAGLEFMVSVDPYLNETTRHAHVVLPPPSPLCRSQYDLALSGLAVRNFAHWSGPLFSPGGPSEAEILARLVLVTSGQDSTADLRLVYEPMERFLLQGALADNPLLAGKQPEELAEQLVGREPVDRYIEILVRAGEYGDQFGAKPGGLSLEVLRTNPHGIDLGPLVPRLPELLKTQSGKIELSPELISEDVSRLAATLSSSNTEDILLIGRRDLRSNNSWMHNLPRLIRGRPRCTLQVHPRDAERLSLTAGGMVRVTSRVGEIVVPIEITDAILSGVVSLPHGFGHDLRGTRLRVASEHAGANVNTITDAEMLDPLSGNAVLSGVPVTLSPA